MQFYVDSVKWERKPDQHRCPNSLNIFKTGIIKMLLLVLLSFSYFSKISVTL